MAQKVTVQLVDDLDGTTAQDVSTVLFGLDGVTYEIDLTEGNASPLRESLADYVESARRVGGRIKRAAATRSHNGGTASTKAGQIREWALNNGFELAGRGRIPAHVVDAYRQAQADAPKSDSAKPDSAKPARSRRAAAGGTRSKKR